MIGKVISHVRLWFGYNQVILLAAVKTAVSIPDSVFQEGERVALRMKISRSRLYARAVESYVKAHRVPDLRKALEAVYGSEPSYVDPVLESLQAEALREEW